ncbi:hypothetical protein AVDCRST_MAG81-4883, partial [uncultured Synechococcales cyanobacterium]
ASSKQFIRGANNASLVSFNHWILLHCLFTTSITQV